MICASCSWYFALRTLHSTPRRRSIIASRSDFSIERVPTSTGRPFSCSAMISSMTASNFAFSLR